jgi:hypothetical protein
MRPARTSGREVVVTLATPVKPKANQKSDHMVNFQKWMMQSPCHAPNRDFPEGF